MGTRHDGSDHVDAGRHHRDRARQARAVLRARPDRDARLRSARVIRVRRAAARFIVRAAVPYERVPDSGARSGATHLYAREESVRRLATGAHLRLPAGVSAVGIPVRDRHDARDHPRGYVHRAGAVLRRVVANRLPRRRCLAALPAEHGRHARDRSLLLPGHRTQYAQESRCMNARFARGRLRAQVIKELLSFLRDPRSRVALIVPPILQLFVFSFAATLEVDNVKIAVVNEDAGRWAYELLARVRGAGFVSDGAFVDNDEALATLLERRQVLIGIHFPSDFSRKVATGEPARAQVLVDGRRANAGQVGLRYLQTIATDLNDDLVGDTARAVPQGVVRYWFNPNLR